MFKRIVGSIVLVTAMASANANTVDLAGPAEVRVGESAAVDIMGTFDNGLFAGGLQIAYDPDVVQIDVASVNVNVDTGLSCPGASNCPADAPGLITLVWGQFATPLIGDATPTSLATLNVTGVNVGVSPLDLLDFSAFTGGWFDSGFGGPLVVDLVSSSIAVVPLPAAVWFMIGGLGALAGLRRK